MSITDKPKTDTQAETLNEILSIQKAAMEIHTNKLEHKLSVHKKAVDLDTLIFLAKYFTTTIVPESQVHKTGPYIRINTQCSDIIVPLKTES